jgi:hypothetical protein
MLKSFKVTTRIFEVKFKFIYLFVVYLPTFSVAQNIALNDRSINE